MQSNGYRKEEGDFSEINHSKILNPLPDYQAQELQSSFPLAYGSYDCQPIGLKTFVGNFVEYELFNFVEWSIVNRIVKSYSFVD